MLAEGSFVEEISSVGAINVGIVPEGMPGTVTVTGVSTLQLVNDKKITYPFSW